MIPGLGPTSGYIGLDYGKIFADDTNGVQSGSATGVALGIKSSSGKLFYSAGYSIIVNATGTAEGTDKSGLFSAGNYIEVLMYLFKRIFRYYLYTFGAVLMLIPPLAAREAAAQSLDEARLVYARGDWVIRCQDRMDSKSCEALMLADIVLDKNKNASV